MEKTGLSPNDPSSFSRPDLVVTRHIHLNLDINFYVNVICGNVTLSVERLEKSATELVLDTFRMRIKSVEDASSNKLKYELSDHIADYGSKLTVQLPNTEDNHMKICIKYETSPFASGLQWVPPQATAGKRLPFMFSQFQSSHARSAIPCQDTPSVKYPYSASITAPPELTVLMSALCEGSKTLKGGKLTYFTQNVPVPSYLIAIAVGALDYRDLGPRTQVWAEKEIIEDCAYEFADTEHQLKTAEDICGPYEWDRYDLLVLPNSFPYGGMENPCLTFVTPTLLAGDKSLANVVAHEIAHSWTGNLVTNKTYEHFWLNEGFTVFVERKIKGRLESPQSQDFDAYTNLGELRETIERLGKDSPLTRLVVDLKGVHPDEAFSTVPYEKGQTFLRYLETTVGGPDKFEPFLRNYFDKFRQQSIDTSDFKKFFEQQFPNCNDIDWDTWLYSPGMPPVIPKYDTSLAIACENLLDKFLNWDGERSFPISEEDVASLSANQKIYFFQKIYDHEVQPVKRLIHLEKIFNLDKVKNAEIKFRWLRICLKARWEDKVQDVFNWINVIGRMKFVRPLYRDLYQWEAVKMRTLDNFDKNRDNMMHVTVSTVAKDLNVED